jgi:hypothetical protein
MARKISPGALFAILAAPLGALALVAGAGLDLDTANSSWAGGGGLNTGGDLVTGTSIAPGNTSNAGSSQTSSASQISINPAYTASTSGNVAGDPTNYADLAIIKLSTAVSADVPVYSLFTGNLQSKDPTFVSYASGGTSSSSGTSTATQQSQLSAGNGASFASAGGGVGPQAPANGKSTNGTSTADASGPTGQIYYYYVPIGSNSPPLTGDDSGGLVGGISVTPVPEPETFAMLLAGLGLMGFMARRRRGKPSRDRKSENFHPTANQTAGSITGCDHESH